MKLYTWSRAPNPRRVLIYLAEKGIDIPVIEVGAEDSRLSNEFLGTAHNRVVPMLELDDGTQIGEAMAICRYLEADHPDPPLFGADRREQALVEMWERRAEQEGIHGAAEVFRNSHPLFADRGLPGFAEPVPQIAGLVERGKQRLNRFYRSFDEALADRPFIAGERFTVADITALCATDFARKVSRVDIPEDCTNFRRWHAEVSARPGAVKG